MRAQETANWWLNDLGYLELQSCVAHFVRIDILINNVGGTIWTKPYAKYEEAQIQAEISRSLFPTLWCCRAALPIMLERGAGVIINISSIATRGVNRVPYAAAKGGVNAITSCVCGVAPGGTKAPPRRADTSNLAHRTNVPAYLGPLR
jgi:dihydroxycyclohexadiene carboxylate dehydrogenase